MQTTITAPRLAALLSPLLASLPAAAVAPSPPIALLPLLSPILRQRVQLLSGADSDPWLPLLCYDASKTSQLETIVKSDRLEAHPVSGEVEVDWDGDTQIRYRRIDEETLQAVVVLQELGLSIRLVWCVNDEVGGGDGWRIGEVGVRDSTGSAWGAPTISASESSFRSAKQHLSAPTTSTKTLHPPEEDEEDDDDYWAQYDKTPGHTPAPKHSPAPHTAPGASSDDDYYAQYASVQPAMDNHDPDEAQEQGAIESSLGRDEITRELQSKITSNPELHGTSDAWSDKTPPSNHVNGLDDLVQPRPTSSAGSSGSETVERLEKRAEESSRGHSETGIKQHISTSVKSLYRLAKVAGIERQEFERLVRTELEVLSLMDDEE
jgi:hypothetical protein